MVKDIAVDISPTQESNSKSFCIDEVGVKTLPGKIITDLDPSKRMNFASSVIRKSTKFIYFGLLTFNATSKQNSFFGPSTRTNSLNGTGGSWTATGLCLAMVLKEWARLKHTVIILRILNLKLEKFLNEKILRLRIFHWHDNRILWLHYLSIHQHDQRKFRKIKKGTKQINHILW